MGVTSGSCHHGMKWAPLHTQKILHCCRVRAVFGREKVAVRPVFQFMTPRIFPIIKNLAAQNMPPDAPGCFSTVALEVLMTAHQIIHMRDLKCGVVETRTSRRL